MIVGGVATSKGDLRWTRMVERCLIVEDEPDWLGEKAATVRGSGSSLDLADTLSAMRAGEDAISAIQGVSRVQVISLSGFLLGTKQLEDAWSTYQTQPCKSKQFRVASS